MFNEGTERPYSSDLLDEKRKGFYHCANCGNKLFASNSKFDSGTGWPSFSEALPGAFKTKTDYSFGVKRVEYHCANCGAHHGHVFFRWSNCYWKRILFNFYSRKLIRKTVFSKSCITCSSVSFHTF